MNYQPTFVVRSIALATLMLTNATANPQPEPTIVATDMRTMAAHELELIRTIASGSQTLTKDYLQDIWNTPLTSACHDAAVEGRKFHGCNFSPTNKQPGAIELELAKTLSEYGTKGFSATIFWKVSNSATCVSKKELSEIFQVRPTRNRDLGTRDLIGGVNTLPHFDDYELILPTPGDPPGESAYLYVAENNHCTTQIVLHKSY